MGLAYWISVNSDSDQDARERLLKAAGPIFASRGFAGATVREICSKAKVNIASVGYYFRDKMGLYREVIESIHGGKSRRFPIPDGLTHTDPEDRLLAFVLTLLSRMLEEGEEGWQVRLLLRELEQPTEAIDTIVNEHFAPVFDQLCSTLGELIAGDIDSQDLKHFALSVIGQCLHYRVSGQAIGRIMGTGNTMPIEQIAIHITSVTLAAASSNFHHVGVRLRESIQSESTSYG